MKLNCEIIPDSVNSFKSFKIESKLYIYHMETYFLFVIFVEFPHKIKITF